MNTVIAFGVQIPVHLLTVRDKLRHMFGADLPRRDPQPTSVSYERDKAFFDTLLGRSDLDPAMAVLHALSHFVNRPAATGWHVALLDDAMAHAHAPGSAAANAFCEQLDEIVGSLDARGVRLGITSAHSMNSKARTQHLDSYVCGFFFFCGMPNSILFASFSPYCVAGIVLARSRARQRGFRATVAARGRISGSSVVVHERHQGSTALGELCHRLLGR